MTETKVRKNWVETLKKNMNLTETFKNYLEL